MSDAPHLSVIIPAINEGPNLAILLPRLRAELDALAVPHEILIVVNRPDPETAAAAAEAGAEVIQQTERGYGGALLSGFGAARGRFLLTMDADLSHPPDVVRALWSRRNSAEVTIASRYVPGGGARMPLSRFLLSRTLNALFRGGLSVSVHDLSSGFRLYQAGVVRRATYKARDFDILQEILLRAYAEGWSIAEVPFRYQPRRHGSSNARVFRFGLAYLRTFGAMWRLRNSISSADYDYRAHDSRIPLQRYWQRSRFRHVTDLIAGHGAVLDVGCGSSRIIGALPLGSVALDVLHRKLRFARRFGTPLVLGSGLCLPFRDGAFPCVLCSEVIEHIPKESGILDELCRVLAPGGRLVLGTPDYARWEWRLMERLYDLAAPGGYAEEHVARYTRRELVDGFRERGYDLCDTRYILRGELIMASRKLGTPRP